MTVAVTDDSRALAQRLAEFIRAAEPDAAEPVIEGLRRSAIGYSRENWIFDATWRAGEQVFRRPLIMRRDPAGSVLATDRNVEYELLKALEPTAIPSPVARWLDRDGSWFGRPTLVMDRIGGECEMFAIEGPRPLEDRLRLAGDCVDLLAQVHQLDWQHLGLGPVLGDNGSGGAAREVAYWTAEMQREQMAPDPRLDELAAWLSEHAPAPTGQVLVHGDFKPGNMLLRDGRIAALLDWETAHIGDPAEDLGWITNPLRYREHQIANEWETAQILERYEQLTGNDLDRSSVRYWNVLANFKLSVIVLTGMRSYAEKRSDRPFDFPTPLIDLAFQLIEGV
jgi:aminoglycoside phosphotransferase (APT) family kinase protein